MQRRLDPLSRRALLTAAVQVGLVPLVPLVPLVCPEILSGSDDELQRRLDAVPPGGTFVIDTQLVRTDSLRVTRPVTIRFVGGSIRMRSDADALRVSTSDVLVLDPVITGAGAETGGLGRGVAFVGNALAPIRNVRVRGGVITDIPHDGVSFAYCTGFESSRTVIRRTGYSGVLVIGGVDGTLQDLTVDDVRQPAGRPNSYGITISRDATLDVAHARRSSRVRVLRNTVSRVLQWEGIDTHAGEAIEIRGNRVSECRVGIAAVPSKDPADRSETLLAPLGVVIADNSVTKSVDLADGAGILVSGAGATVGSDRERATVTVSGNTVQGCGGGLDGGAVLLKLTSGAVVEDNRLLDSRTSAISLPHSNHEVSVARNTVRTVAGGGIGVNVPHGANSGTIASNRFEDSTPRLAVALRFGTAPNRFTLRGNDPGNAVLPEATGGAIITR